MRSDTQTVTIEADARLVYQFLADPETLPRWAVGFCRSIRRDGEHWVAQTAQGDVESALRKICEQVHGYGDVPVGRRKA